MQIKSKECNDCKKDLHLKFFHKSKIRKDGHNDVCQVCMSARHRSWYAKNKEKRLRQIDNYRKDKKDVINSKARESYVKNRKANIERTVRYKKIRYETDPLYRLIALARSATTRAFKKINETKTKKSTQLLGCSFDKLKAHIESLFTEGMSWDLIGSRIHIDHIKPLALARTKKDIEELCHYTNLQPLWAEDNIKKGAKYVKL